MVTDQRYGPDLIVILDFRRTMKTRNSSTANIISYHDTTGSSLSFYEAYTAT
jgi:hypothetical protein